MSDKKSGHVGVAWHKGINKWTAYINVGGRRTNLGNFRNLEDAIQARENAESDIVRPKGKIALEKERRLVDAERERLHYKNADMSKLSVDQRAYLLDYLDGMRVQDIADKYGVKKHVAYNRIREAKHIIDTGSAYSPQEIDKRRKYAQAYYQKHKDEMKAYSRKYAEEHHEEVREANRRNYIKNREKRLEKRREYNKKYYAKNKEQILAAQKLRRQDRMLDEKILKAFNKYGSVKGAVEETGCSWNRVVKSLSSSGIIINETHGMILDMHDTGMTAQEIARQLSLNVKTVQAYLPRTRPMYGENRSKNAIKIKEWRDKRKTSPEQ